MKNHSPCLPDPTQELLLKACLSPPNQAVACWKLWRTKTDIENLDYGSFRLLPLLYKNLQTAGVEAEKLLKYRSVYRHFWYKNRLYLHRLGQFLEQYNRSGADLPLLLKGIPLVLNYYSDPGLRPMSDIDIMVAESDLPIAFNLLEENGWIAEKQLPDRPTPFWLQVERECHFKNQAGIEIDLHWNLALENNYVKDDNRGYFQRGRKVSVGAGRAIIPDATDLLYHVIIHGMRWNVVHPLRWIPDVMVILKHDGDEIDWNRIFSMAQRDHFNVCLKKAVQYLTTIEMENLIPPHVRRLLICLNFDIWETLEFWFFSRYIEILGGLPEVYFLAYRYSLKSSGWRNKWIAFTKFILYKWGLQHPYQLPGEIILRLGRRLKAAIKNKTSV